MMIKQMQPRCKAFPGHIAWATPKMAKRARNKLIRAKINTADDSWRQLRWFPCKSGGTLHYHVGHLGSERWNRRSEHERFLDFLRQQAADLRNSAEIADKLAAEYLRRNVKPAQR